uniref:Glutaredoxin-related protein 5, mitochondrial n=1 Tax=Panagrellus redivivus TaxID=6233 RepID=A0A7E4ZUX1_PANRE
MLAACSPRFLTPSLARTSFRALSSAATELTPELKERIDSALTKDKVVVFMKGTQEQPACGFSRNVKMVLDYHEVNFQDYNVLEDEDLRNGIKLYSDWPTIPQVYVKKQFVGGSDILIQMHKEGEITDFFDQNEVPSKFSDKFPSSKPE